jgi:hypothetical protein
VQIQQAKKKAEKELASWFAEGLLDEQEAHETWMVITDLLDGFAAGEYTGLAIRQKQFRDRRYSKSASG